MEVGGFNGATIRRPWMGSRPVTNRGAVVAGFNGATIRRPWMVGCSGHLDALPVSLQWGHDPKTVDGTHRCCGGFRPHRSRFNGATIRRPWMARRSACQSRPTPTRLQWGHDPKTVDGSKRSRNPYGQSGVLQWGHDPKTVDGLDRCSTPVAPLAGFNGATIRRPWMATYPLSQQMWAELASMGPRSEDRGWLGLAVLGSGLLSRLQWGHDPKTVDGQCNYQHGYR